jgi:hypothetical protein
LAGVTFVIDIVVETVTTQFAVLLPSAVVTVIVALPIDMPVTVPFEDTVTTEEALVLHVTFLFVALYGETVTVKVALLPTKRDWVVLSNVTPVTETGPGTETVTAQVAVLFPSAVVTVMDAVPAATAVTVPFDTVATEVALLLHVTFLFVALAGATVAVKASVFPTSRDNVVLFNVTPVTDT